MNQVEKEPLSEDEQQKQDLEELQQLVRFSKKSHLNLFIS
jgi:hypothetical protein